MSEHLQVTMFGGSAGGRIEEAYANFHAAWERNGKNWGFDPEWTANIETMYLAQHLAQVLHENRIGLISGGTDEGTMGAANSTLGDLIVRDGRGIPPIGVPLNGYFPLLNPHPAIDMRGVQTLHDRFAQFNEGDAFLALRGQHGTHTELTFIIEDERLKDIAYDNHPQRPIIIADQTPRTLRALTVIYGELYPGFVMDNRSNVTDRIYLLTPSAFTRSREHPLNPMLQFSPGGQRTLLSIIRGNVAQTAKLAAEGYVQTLRQAILEKSGPE